MNEHEKTPACDLKDNLGRSFPINQNADFVLVFKHNGGAVSGGFSTAHSAACARVPCTQACLGGGGSPIKRKVRLPQEFSDPTAANLPGH
jgi:hypothetical protein